MFFNKNRKMYQNISLIDSTLGHLLQTSARNLGVILDSDLRNHWSKLLSILLYPVKNHLQNQTNTITRLEKQLGFSKPMFARHSTCPLFLTQRLSGSEKRLRRSSVIQEEWQLAGQRLQQLKSSVYFSVICPLLSTIRSWKM